MEALYIISIITSIFFHLQIDSIREIFSLRNETNLIVVHKTDEIVYKIHLKGNTADT